VTRFSALLELPLRHRWLRWAALAAGIALSFGAADLFHRQIHDEAAATFHATAIDKASAIDMRIRAYTDVLYALRGLFDASGKVTRDDFHQFAESLSLGERYPGLNNISFSPLVRNAEKHAFEQAVRAETTPLLRGMPEFSIGPPGERPDYVVLHYVEPMGKNVPGWGLDLMVDPLRRSAVERARDTGGISSISGVTLRRDAGAPVTSTLLRLAAYRGGGVPKTIEERQRLFVGVVGSAVRVGELVEASLTRETLARMRIRIFAGGELAHAGDSAAPEQLLYDSRPASAPVAYPGFTANQRITLADREWRVAISPLVDPTDPFDRALAAGVLTVSLLLSLLFFWLMSALTTVERGRVELAKRNREAALLTSLGEDLHSCLNVKEAHEVLTKHMPQILPGTAAVLFAFDAAHARATEARWGSPRSLQDEFAPQGCQAIRRGHPYHVADCAKGLNCAHFIGHPANAYVCVPLNAQGELIGMLHVQAAAQTALGDSEVNLIKAAAQHLSLALANLGLREKLVEQATRDNLTGLYNRHYMRDWLAHELLRAARHQRSIGVIMLDVDHFKRVNDVFGHEAGDLVLRELAGVMRRLARGSDVICRQGGEEFLLLLPEAPADATLAKAEELRAQVAALKLEYAGQALGTVTISLGVAAFPRDGADTEALLRSADAALYAAKRSGRNRAVVASGKAGVMHDETAVAPAA